MRESLCSSLLKVFSVIVCVVRAGRDDIVDEDDVDGFYNLTEDDQSMLRTHIQKEQDKKTDWKDSTTQYLTQTSSSSGELKVY